MTDCCFARGVIVLTFLGMSPLAGQQQPADPEKLITLSNHADNDRPELAEAKAFLATK